MLDEGEESVSVDESASESESGDARGITEIWGLRKARKSVRGDGNEAVAVSLRDEAGGGSAADIFGGCFSLHFNPLLRVR